MIKKNKGFTLIELLAVIVILAVIALIATPIIMGVINDSKKGAAKDSMYSYVKAVELAATADLKPDTNPINGTYTIKDGNLYNGSTKVLDIDLKGTKPETRMGNIVLEKGQVKSADLKFDDYCIGYDGEKAVNKDECLSQPVVYTAGDIIYYNPETNKECTSAEVNTTVNAKTGCLKWNVITLGDTSSKPKIDIMLDHNSTGKVAWNSSGISAEGMKEVSTALQADVSTWHTSVKSTARLITGQEVANIGADTNWNQDKYVGTVYRSQSWLYQNLYVTNTNETPYGYWTSTALLSYTNLAWYVSYIGDLNRNNIKTDYNYGVRPVITISKSIIS